MQRIGAEYGVEPGIRPGVVDVEAQRRRCVWQARVVQPLPDAIDALGKFSAIAASAIQQSRQALVDNLRNIAPVLRSLADAGPALTKGLDFLSTYPWVKSTVPNWFRGDFANITLVIDLTLSRLDSSLFTGTRWEGDLTELEMQWGRTIGQMPSPYTSGNPLIAPYHFGGY